MLKFIKTFMLAIFIFTISNAQNVIIEKVNDSNNEQSYKIDARPFLEEQEKAVTKFLNENPNYFEDLKLQKKAAWNFTVGSTKSWYAYNFTTEGFYSAPATCRAVGTNCYVFVEDAIWGTGVNQANVDAIQLAFDNSTPANPNKGVYQTVVETFGAPPDVDSDPKIIIFILDIRDGYAGSGGYILGYFHSVNQINMANSNLAEIYYLDANPSDLSTPAGLDNVMSTTAHEFQHMVHFNYHDGTTAKPSQVTFLNEGCSLAAEVVCGYSIYGQSLFNNEFNHYLFDWRSGDEVLSDYSRAARYVTYLYEQFGTEFLGKLVRSTKTEVPSINDALAKLSTPTTLRFPQTLENWFVANTLNNKTVNPAWGYTTPGVNTVSEMNQANPNVVSDTITIERAASDYIQFSGGNNLSIKFDDLGTGKLKFKAIKYKVNNEVEVDILNPNTQYLYSDYGTVYKTISFAISNINAYETYDYAYTATGEANIVTLAYDLNEPTGVLPLLHNDTVCVFFDGVLGAKLDSIKVALRQAGSVKGSIYEYTGTTRPSPLGKVIYPNLTVTSNIAERPVYNTETQSYPIPFPNWITVDLTSANLDASKSFVAAFVVENTYPEFNRIMITEQPAGNIHSYTYFTPTSSETPDWYYISSSETTVYAYLIRAYVSFGVTGVEDQVIELLPKEFTVDQNYPNPFNPSTTMDFSIPSNELVKLDIYNSLGQLVKSLINKEMAAGKYSVNFDGQNLSSGIYYYKLSAGDFVTTKKMILMK